MITSVTVTNDDGTTQVFTPEVTTTQPEIISVPLDTDIKIVAR